MNNNTNLNISNNTNNNIENNNNIYNINIINNILFYKIWRNIILKKKIFNHIKKFNSNYSVSFSSRDQLLNYKEREYIQCLEILIDIPLEAGDIPYGVHTLSFGDAYDFPLSNVIPHSVTSLKLGYLFQHSIKDGELPDSLKDITFGENFNQQLIPLPKNCENVTFGWSFNKPLSINGETCISSSVKKIHFGNLFNQKICPGDLQNVEVLEFEKNYNQPLVSGCLPPTLVSLSFYGHFNQALTLGSLPTGFLTKIIFSNSFNQPIESGVIPQTVKHITFGKDFNQTIANSGIPKSIVTLNLGSNFNNVLDIGEFSSLTELKISDRYDQPLLDNWWKSKTSGSVCLLKKLEFGYDFNQYLRPFKSIPPTVETLIFGHSFNEPLDYGSIPPSVTCLSLKESIDYNIIFEPDISLPNSILSLQLGYYYNQPFQPKSLPDSLTSLTLGSSFNHSLGVGCLPPSLTSISFGLIYNKPFFPNSLPSSLKTLHLGYSFNQPLENLPISLTKLILGAEFNQPLRIQSLTALKTLLLGRDYNLPFDQESLPQSLETIEFGFFFNQKLSNLPLSIKKIVFSRDFNIPIDQSLAHLPLLEVLEFGRKFNQNIFPDTFPKSLKTLIFGTEFNKPIENCIPTSVTSITFGLEFKQPIESIPKSTNIISASKK
ncbi:hypothetical protein DICPUDRAFT_73890 [Dictyostelium purpureum]|uniref:FNIP repeat-containing protein n=1 Tax=Dictyostelium purpureum TaxID=5786 RepID=F0Z660_DICPU|nr:uncharacterized protein DICPUDRAFT_73890 [Dictyostelium purpureum]EGC40598.1 hypothetical protein DICPUDRAFT_73890 [Dictyostelium purpureum]|eukprot:XP_003282934.1 hypothetical protein DICPUDRAFT_73890 [Dictyostelium purpureum]